MLKGNLNPAKKGYKLSIKYDDKNINAYNLLGITCQQLSDNRCVKYVYENLLQFNPNDWTINYNLGRFYDGQGNYKLAEKEYNIAIKNSSPGITPCVVAGRRLRAGASVIASLPGTR